MEEKDKKSFKELWKNPRTHALMVLGLWGVFFISIFIFLEIASLFNKNDYVKPTENVENTVTLASMVDSLNKSNYKFLLKKSNSYSDYQIDGQKDNEEISGYLENQDGIIKILYKENNLYRVVSEEEILDTTLLTENDINIILNNKINDNLQLFVENTESNLYEFVNSETNEKITIYFENDLITKIITEDESATYEVSYNIEQE